MAEETFVKNIAKASVWEVVSRKDETTSDAALSRATGATCRQIKSARSEVEELIKAKTKVTALRRKQRKDFIQVKLEPYVWDFTQDDDYTRLDTNQRIVDVVNPRTGKSEPVHQRIWKNVNKKQRHLLFKASDHYQRFQSDNPRAKVSWGTWRKVLKKVAKKYVCNPRPELCVDEKMSALEHFMASMFEVSKWKCVSEGLEGFAVDGKKLTLEEATDLFRKAGSHQMIEAMCCEKRDEPDLHIDKSKSCPKMIPLQCTHGTDGKGKNRCTCCGVAKTIGPVLDAIRKTDAGEREVEVMVWKKAARQGLDSSGKQNTQQELQPEKMTVKELVVRFKLQLETCITHYQTTKRSVG